MREIEERRFAALAGYWRHPLYVQAVQEYAWLESDDGRTLGVLTWDRTDYDFGWLALARDARGRFRSVNMQVGRPSAAEARRELLGEMERLAAEAVEPDAQSGAAPAVDFFAPGASGGRLHPSFEILLREPRYSPARGLIAAMMHHHADTDGNFVEQFQTAGFDARVWELYLFAAFTELGYAVAPDVQVPDLFLEGLLGRLGIEATTANLTQGEGPPAPATPDELTPYLQGYVPIRLARVLKKKLRRGEPYWSLPHMKDVPFVIAVQDFHAAGSMRMIVPAATEYVFGVRHSTVEGRRHIEWIDEHRFGKARERSGFFRLPEAENVSAVIVNPQGTLVKFNRLGYLAGFGDRRVRMTRFGIRRHDDDPADPRPRRFAEHVHAPGYEESWVEGMVVLHNPRARIPLHPDLVPGATHEFLEPDGRIMSLLPASPPYFSQTCMWLDGDDDPRSTAEG